MRTAFTLVELLVVVTIIVVLLALLVPALDKAVYHAELLQCMGKLKVIGAGASTYAVDYKRWLPLNEPANGKGWISSGLRSGVSTVTTNNDIRPRYSPYMPINKAMNDPFVRAVDLENAPTSLIYGSYSLYSSWRFAPYDKRQSKLGDRFNWKGPDKTNPGVEYSWDVLAADFTRSVAGWWTSHPDKQGIAVLRKFEPSGGAPPTDYTSTYWIASPVRGDVDLNYVRQDGSVTSYRDVTALNDSGFVYTNENSSGNSDYQHLLPKQ